MFTQVFFKNKSTPEQKPYPKLITHQSPDVVNIIDSFLYVKDLKSLAKDSHRAFFSKRLAVKMLLQAVVFGELGTAVGIISEHPQLLLERGTVRDYSGRIHSNRTAFQLALGASDYNIADEEGNREVNGMVEMIVNSFMYLPGKNPQEINKIINEQYLGQFPEDYEKIEAKKILDDSFALNRMVDFIDNLEDEKDCNTISAIEDVMHQIIHREKSKRAYELSKIIYDLLKATSPTLFEKSFKELKNYLIDKKLIKNDINFDLLHALYQFRNHLEPKGYQKIGHHFNNQLLSEAAKLYKNNYTHFGSHGSPKNLFCFQKVFGGIQYLVPSCDGQNIAYGLNRLSNKKAKPWEQKMFRHSLSFYYDDDNDKYFHHNLNSTFVMGHNSAANSEGCLWWEMNQPDKMQSFITYFEKKQQQRQISLDNLLSSNMLPPASPNLLVESNSLTM